METRYRPREAGGSPEINVPSVRYAVQWKVKEEVDTPQNWLFFVSYTEFDKAKERYEHLVKVNGKNFDYQIILVPGGNKVLM